MAYLVSHITDFPNTHICAFFVSVYFMFLTFQLLQCLSICSHLEPSSLLGPSSLIFTHGVTI